MKYIIELDEIPNTGLFKARGANTLVFDKKGIENILEPYKEEHEIDWSKVSVDTPILVRDSEDEEWQRILVRDSEDEEWQRRYFAKYVNGVLYTWTVGRTSWSADDDDVFAWNIAKLAEEGEE